MSDVRPALRVSGQRRARNALYLAAAALGALALGSGPANAATLVVDKDGQQCRNADYQSISAAVAAARPGDKIKVCPDLYTESVVVAKPGLKLTAKGRSPRDCFDPTPALADPTRQAIVTAPAGNIFDLQADRITLSGFVVQGARLGTGQPSAATGIRTGQGFSGYRVRRNVLQQTRIGAAFGGSGERLSRLSHNCFRRNGSGQIGGGVFSTAANVQAELDNGRIDHNSFFQNTFGIRLGGGDDIRVDHNRSSLDGVFIRPAFTRALEISSNRVGEGSGPAISFFFNPAFPQANTNAVISHNVVEDRGGHAIVADPNSTGTPPGTLSGSLISHNRLTGNALDGINLAAGNTGNRVEQNRSVDNGSDGIHAQGATGNVFAGNRMSGNAEHDAHDDNRATNQWIGNRCATDFPAGTICRQKRGKKK